MQRVSPRSQISGEGGRARNESSPKEKAHRLAHQRTVALANFDYRLFAAFESEGGEYWRALRNGTVILALVSSLVQLWLR